MQIISGRLVITPEQSNAFARLSGDYNPLHTDALAARRLQFGSTVVHGVHHMMQVWDAAFSQFPEATDSTLASLRAGFPNPVRAGETIDYHLTPRAGGADLVATVSGKRVLTLAVGLTTESGSAPPTAIIDAPPPVEQPVDQIFPPGHDNGECGLYVDAELSRTLFPFLSRLYPASLLGQIMACTAVVGMRCPGLHSVFSALSLEIRDGVPGGRGTLRYHVKSSDSRFHLVKIAVEGPETTGMLDAFFRPAVVEQPTYASIRAVVRPDQFADRRALVIGGSRGSGETTAKILAAGGAAVTITYNSGEADAVRVQEQILAGGGQCHARHCNVLDIPCEDLEKLIGDFAPSHVYYFSSPKIESEKGDSWNEILFGKYCEFYLAAFAKMAHCIGRSAPLGGDKLTVFYPSSIYVERPERGFREYAVAKAAGEALCRQLQTRFPQVEFVAPRLPRMATDQTASIIPTKSEPALTVMMRYLCGDQGQSGS